MRILLTLLVLSSVALVVRAQDTPPATSTVRVEVTNLATGSGIVQCALFPSADGFPYDLSRATAVLRVRPAGPDRAICEFRDVPPGTYAVTMSHDENANGHLDTNFLGIPTERWGISTDPEPFMRAPTFDESRFPVAGEPVVAVGIRGR